MIKQSKSYKEKDSPFYRLKSQKKLADLLFCNVQKLRKIAREDNLYHQFKKQKKDGGHRLISAPRHDLKIIQKRIANLLQRIAPPDYLFAPVSGRSYVDNAAIHQGSKYFRLLDIENFFQNCSDNKVIWFFHRRMGCSPDVSAIIKALVTHNGSLPQGSPCSPILAYLTYVDMWEEVAGIVSGVDCTFSVYADDLTISGRLIPERTVWEIKKVIRRHGHSICVTKERRKIMKAEITGVIVRPDGLYTPHRQHKKRHELKDQYTNTKSSKEKIFLLQKLNGYKSKFDQISSRRKIYN